MSRSRIRSSPLSALPISEGAPWAATLPSFRMMTFEQMASTSWRMWVERMTVLLSPERLDELADLDDLVGVEPRRRLVEDEDGRVVEDGLGEAEALPVALGQVLDLLAVDAREAAGADRALDGRAPRAAGLGAGIDAPRVGREVEVLGHREVLVEGDGLGQVADAALDRDGSSATSMPSTRAVPELGKWYPVRTFMMVVLPAPFGPSRPRTEPVSAVKLTPWTASTPP